MPVIVAPDFARKSPYLFSATIVGALAKAGVEGVAEHAPAAEMFGPDAPTALVLG